MLRSVSNSQIKSHTSFDGISGMPSYGRQRFCLRCLLPPRGRSLLGFCAKGGWSQWWFPVRIHQGYFYVWHSWFSFIFFTTTRKLLLHGRPSFLYTLSHLVLTTAQSFTIFGSIFKRRLKLRELNYVVQRHKDQTHHSMYTDTDAGNLEAQTFSLFANLFYLTSSNC